MVEYSNTLTSSKTHAYQARATQIEAERGNHFSVIVDCSPVLGMSEIVYMCICSQLGITSFQEDNRMNNPYLPIIEITVCVVLSLLIYLIVMA